MSNKAVMEAICEGVYTKEIPLYNFKPVQYMAVVRKAAERLRWQVRLLQQNVIECHTGSDHYSGNIIVIKAEKDKGVLACRPVNEYDCDGALLAQEADTLQQAIAATAHEAQIADRNLHPMHREPYGALVFSKSYTITPFLVYANILVLLAMVLSGISILHPTAQELYVWGGNLRPSVTHGEWWRLVTYQFLHGGVMHLLMNTFALLYIGMFLEPLMGKLRFASAYLMTGIFAGLVSIAVHPASVGVGASGAIFGMYGVFLALLTTRHIKKTLRKTMLRSILFFVVLNLMYGLQGNTDNAAHIGGLLSGLFIGYAYYPGINKQHVVRKQVTTTVVLGVCTVIAVVVSMVWLR